MSKAQSRTTNPMLFPASTLRSKKEWGDTASGLPEGAVLCVLPAQESAVTQAVLRIAATWRRRGRLVTVLSS